MDVRGRTDVLVVDAVGTETIRRAPDHDVRLQEVTIRARPSVSPPAEMAVAVVNIVRTDIVAALEIYLKKLIRRRVVIIFQFHSSPKDGLQTIGILAQGEDERQALFILLLPVIRKLKMYN